MFIDIHVHTRSIPGPLRNGKPAFATPEQLLARYEPIGVEQAVLLPCVSPECDYVPQSNQEILEVCKRHPGRLQAVRGEVWCLRHGVPDPDSVEVHPHEPCTLAPLV